MFVHIVTYLINFNVACLSRCLAWPVMTALLYISTSSVPPLHTHFSDSLRDETLNDGSTDSEAESHSENEVDQVEPAGILTVPSGVLPESKTSFQLHMYRIALIFRGSKFWPIAVSKELVLKKLADACCPGPQIAGIQIIAELISRRTPNSRISQN